MLLRWIAALPRRHYTYRFLFIPGTIGSIAWLALHRAEVGRIRHGLVLSCLGDAGQPTYKRSRRGDAAIDRIVTQVLRHAGPHAVQEFSPYGYDERQYCSPGFNLAVGRLSRTPNGAYPEYHTSADNLDFVSAGALEHSLDVLQQVVEILEHDRSWINLSPFGEPQLGRRGLYRTTGGTDLPAFELAVLWVLNQADGRATLLDTAERAGIPFSTIRRAADALAAAGLLAAAPATALGATCLPATSPGAV